MTSIHRRRGSLALMSSLAVVLAVPAAAAADIERVSVGPAGAQSNAASGSAAVSRDGRFVAFASEAANLMAGDSNGAADVFIRDRVTGTTTRVSVGSGGREPDGFSSAPSLSGDGRIVAFSSRATNLVADDANGDQIDVFVHDQATGTTVRLPVPGALAAGETWASHSAAVSPNGRYVAFAAGKVARSGDEDYDVGPQRVYVHDRASGRTRQVSVSSREVAANGESGEPAISADGRYVTFQSAASNLVARDTNRKPDIYVRDRRRGTTVRVSIGTRGAQARDASFEPALSTSGRYVAFTSRAALGRHDDDHRTDIYVHDRRTGRIARVSAGLRGWATAPTISGNGRVIAFQLSPTDLIADGSGPIGTVYVRDRAVHATRAAVGASDDRSGDPSLSADGRTLALTSSTTDLIAGDTNGVGDVFVIR
jgi:Tol biopolymer transport system component